MKNNVLFVVVVAFVGGCVTRNNIVTKSVTPGPWGTNVVTHEDKSWSVNQLGSSVSHNGNLFHFRAAVGGGPVYGSPIGGRYGYNVGQGGGHYGYLEGRGHPMITVPIESQRYYERETWNRYGLGRGDGGHHRYNVGPGGGSGRGYGY